MQRGFHRLHAPMLLLLLNQEDLELNEDELFHFITLWLEAQPQAAPTAAPQVLCTLDCRNGYLRCLPQRATHIATHQLLLYSQYTHLVACSTLSPRILHSCLPTFPMLRCRPRCCGD